MSQPNDTVFSYTDYSAPKFSEKYFELSDDRKFRVKGVSLLSDLPNNVFFTEYSILCKLSDTDAPPALLHFVKSISCRGGFFGFQVKELSDRVTNSLGKFTDRNFLSIFRFKAWWSSQWVGTNGSDLEMETQWVLFDVPEIKSYVLIVPLIEGSFRSALHPGDDGHVMICAESGSTLVKSSSFKSIAYVHVSDNPYNIMKEAYSAIRVHLNTFKLLEEKSTPTIKDRFGWCTWDAFYLTVDPRGVWHGVDEFSEGGIPLKFLIIDDGWQSISFDSDEPPQDCKNIVLGRDQMTARLYRLQEGEKFRKYKAQSLFSPNSFLSYDSMRPKKIIAKSIEIRETQIAGKKAVESSMLAEAHSLDLKVKKLKQELQEMLRDKEQEDNTIIYDRYACQDGEYGMKAFTHDLRTKFKHLDDIWVWHALLGAWGGVRPGATHVNSKVMPVKISPGLDGVMEDAASVKIAEGGIGLVHPDQATDFYDSMHSNLACAGITGVKVDVMNTLEYLCEEHGGRINLAKRYYDGLTKSVKRNFSGINVLSSMQQCNDFFFLGTKQISMGGVADDFWGKDPYGDPEGELWLQGLHMVHCSYNSLWMGQIIHPDWDMFTSDHVCAFFHAASRAICGGPIYVSDSLGGHDFDLLRKLIYPDGNIPICQYFALPTRDCMFKSPLFDENTVLKIWNFNKYGGVIGAFLRQYGGVIGAFNCRGAGWDRKERRFKGYKQHYKAIEGSVHVNDIEWDQKLEALQMSYAEEYAVYLNQENTIVLMNHNSDPIHVVLKPSSFELYSFVPIENIKENVKFAPIGLRNMYNSGGTIQELEYTKEGIARLKIKGRGTFLAYSNKSPKFCVVNGGEVNFMWTDRRRIEFDVSWVDETGGVSEVIIQF